MGDHQSQHSIAAGMLATWFFALAGVGGPASACLWDRDTLAMEGKGVPEVIRVITGRFERNPPIFYEMRLARVTKEARLHPERLDLYDDAGVACDRLGRDDEAIDWMARKKAVLDRLGGPTQPKVHDDWYRYYTNLGTFHAHRWARGGADRHKIDDLRRAKKLLTTAIQINPGAHFGREKYQLRAIEWILASASKSARSVEFFDPLPENATAADAHEAVQGLSGLIVLGNAWESVDVFHALAAVLQADGERSSVAYMTRLRACELAEHGGRSMVDQSLTGPELKAAVLAPVLTRAQITDDGAENVAWAFKELRREAEEWQKDRAVYMEARLRAGRHPDTDPAFWSGYRDAPPPAIPERFWTRVRRWEAMVAGALSVLVGAPLLAGVLIYRRKRRRKLHFAMSGKSRMSEDEQAPAEPVSRR